jgi:hypothetical protein
LPSIPRYRFAFCVCFLVGAAFAAPSRAATINFQDEGRDLFVPVKALGRDMLLLLDTGADHTLLDARFERSLNGSGQDVVIRTANASTNSARYFGAPINISVEETTLTSPIILTADLQTFKEFTGIPLDGILGQSALTNVAIEIVFTNNSISFGRRPEGVVSSTVVYNFVKPARTFMFPAETHDAVPLAMVLDSGCSFPVALTLSDWRRVFPASPLRTTTREVLNFKGEAEERLIARLPLLKVGKNSYTNLLCVRMNTDKIPSRLGLDFLRKHSRVIIDYRGEKVYFEQGGTYQDELDMTGLAVKWTEKREMQIHSVRKGSPAEVAGLLNGDKIVAIDGKQSQQVSNLDRVNSFRAGDGRKLKLKIQRDGKTNEVELTLVKEL